MSWATEILTARNHWLAQDLVSWARNHSGLTRRVAQYGADRDQRQQFNHIVWIVAGNHLNWGREIVGTPHDLAPYVLPTLEKLWAGHEKS